MATSDGVQVTMKPPVKELQRRHKKRLEKLKNMKSPMKKIAIFLDRWVQKNFKTEGGNVGGWQKLAAGGRYIPGRGLDPSAKILHDTGRLRASFKSFAFENNAGIGSDLPYSKKHNDGEDGLPQRRMLPERREVIDDAEKILENHVEKSLK